MRNAALHLIGYWFRVFPLHTTVTGKCSCGRNCGRDAGKHPRTKHGVKDATTDPVQIDRWFTKWPNSNLGLATGNGVLVVDIDGPEGNEELQEWLAGRTLPLTLVAQTGRGYHLYYAGDGLKSSARGKVHVRGDGGYAVVSPSLHASGRRYAWINQCPIAPMPDWFKVWLQGDRSKVTAGRLAAGAPHINSPEYLKQRKLAQEAAGTPSLAAQALRTFQEPWSVHEEARVWSALQAISADCGRDEWLKIGFALHSLGWQRPDGADIGFEIWLAWSETGEEKFQGLRDLEKTWASFGRSGRKGISIGTLFHIAKRDDWTGQAKPATSETTGENAAQGNTMVNPGHENSGDHPGSNERQGQIDEGVSLNDFHAYMPMHNYIFAPSRDPWPASSVNARLGSLPVLDADERPVCDEKGKQKMLPASAWLDQHKPVEQMTWAPGHPLLIRDRLISEGGWIERPKVTCLNLYRPPTITPGNAIESDTWLNHIHKGFGNDANHIIKWLAHRAQRPQEKINHALVLGGCQGIGKDTLLEPVKQAVGPWNFCEVSPHHMLGRFNGFLKSVILRVSEARDLGDVNRFQFYDHMKAYTAAPPDVLRVDEKNLREHSILNCCGVIITTNHKSDGIYLPADDRRHFVAWSDLTKDDFVDGYWNDLWGWYANGGDRHVAAYLAELDLEGFDAKAPPPKTQAFWDIVDASRAPEDAELADVLDKMGNPDAVTIAQIKEKAGVSFFDWIGDRKNRRVIRHRLDQCGYASVHNDAAKDHLWVINGTRQMIYAKSELSTSERLRAARALVDAFTLNQRRSV